MIITKAMAFIMSPNLAIFSILIFPDEKTIAFGGVAIGNIKAQLAPNVKGRAKTKKSTFIDLDMAKINGSVAATNAMFDTSSVTKIPINAIMAISTKMLVISKLER